jgi:hypothetical protein
MFYFDSKLIKLLNLDNNNKYSYNFILNKVIKKKSSYSKNTKVLWKLDKNFLNLIMDFKLVGTKKTFYELFYLGDHIWRDYYMYGFSNNTIHKILQSLTIEKITNYIFINRDTGKKIDKIII